MEPHGRNFLWTCPLSTARCFHDNLTGLASRCLLLLLVRQLFLFFCHAQLLSSSHHHNPQFALLQQHHHHQFLAVTHRYQSTLFSICCVPPSEEHFHKSQRQTSIEPSDMTSPASSISEGPMTRIRTRLDSALARVLTAKNLFRLATPHHDDPIIGASAPAAPKSSVPREIQTAYQGVHEDPLSDEATLRRNLTKQAPRPQRHYVALDGEEENIDVPAEPEQLGPVQ